MQAKQITNLTATEIHVLLDRDVPFTIDREKFEDYITEGNRYYTYEMNEQEYTITMLEYWSDIGAAQVEHINWFIQHEPAILKQLAMLDIVYYVKDEMGESEIDMILLKSKVSHYGHCYFNAAIAYKGDIIGSTPTN